MEETEKKERRHKVKAQISGNLESQETKKAYGMVCVDISDGFNSFFLVEIEIYCQTSSVIIFG